MKKCKICGSEGAHDLLEYCKTCAEALCIVSEGVTFNREAHASIILTEEEAVHRLKLLIEKGWRFNGSV